MRIVLKLQGGGALSLEGRVGEAGGTSGDGRVHLRHRSEGCGYSSRRRLVNDLRGTHIESRGFRMAVRLRRARTSFRTSQLNSFGRFSSLGNRDSLNGSVICLQVDSFKRNVS